MLLYKSSLSFLSRTHRAWIKRLVFRLSPTGNVNREGKTILCGGGTNALRFQPPTGNASRQRILPERRVVTHICTFSLLKWNTILVGLHHLAEHYVPTIHTFLSLPFINTCRCWRHIFFVTYAYTVQHAFSLLPL
jgi:hypothetical protein